MSWKANFKKGKPVVLATASKQGVPNANIVISLGFVDNKLLVADCQMRTTIKNLKTNPRLSVIGGKIRLKGKAKIFSAGKYFNLCVKANPNYQVRHAILITIQKVFDLDKVEKINL